MLLALLLALGTAAQAAPDKTALETEARKIEAQLIAPCCWSQQVSVHQSPAADEIKKDVRLRLARGQARQQIIDDYVVQFGTRILAEPPAQGFSRFLYVLPPVLLLAGAGLVVVIVRRFAAQGRAVGAAGEAPPGPASARGAANPRGARDEQVYRDRLDDELANLE
jgi:cytochrome c-type biogenesis protein CcmH